MVMTSEQENQLVSNVQNLLSLISQKNVQIEQMSAKADFYDAVINSEDGKDMSEVAKILAIPGYDSNQKLFAFLREEGILLSSIAHKNQPSAPYVDKEYFYLNESKWTNPHTGKTNISLTTMTTQKGIEFIRGLINERITNPEN